MYEAVHLIGVAGLLLTFVGLYRRTPRWWVPVGVFGTAWLALGSVLGLAWAPRESMMGDVGRILYVHVPTAWIALVVFTLAFGFAVAYLWTGKDRYDWATEAAIEVGIVLNALLLVLGSLFAKPTWNTWWTWDPRLTASLVMLFTYVGVLILRQTVKDEGRRAAWTSVATIVAFVNIPVTYMVVRWMPTIHQIQSDPSLVDDRMKLVLRMCAWGLLFVALGFIGQRWNLARANALAGRPEPLPEASVV